MSNENDDDLTDSLKPLHIEIDTHATPFQLGSVKERNKRSKRAFHLDFSKASKSGLYDTKAAIP